MEIITDILIIGAGVSGLSSSKEAVLNGNNVMVIDQKKDYTNDDRKEYVTKTNLRQIGLKKNDSWVVNETSGFVIESYKNNQLVLDESNVMIPEKSYVIDRQKFLEELQKEAQELGVSIKYNTKAVNVKYRNDKVVVETISNDKELEIECKIIIIAEGSNNNISKLFNLNYDFSNEKIKYVLEYELDNTNLDSNNIKYQFTDKQDCLICLLPQKDNKASVIISMDDDNQLEDTLNDYIKNSHELNNARIINKSKGIIPSNNILLDRTADNVMVTGSCAGFSNPLTIKGLNESLQSGVYAGVVASNQSLFEEFKKINLNKYIMYTDMLVNDYFKQYKQTHQFIESITPDDMDLIITQMNDSEIYESDIESLLRTLIDVSPKANLQLKDLFK